MEQKVSSFEEKEKASTKALNEISCNRVQTFKESKAISQSQSCSSQSNIKTRDNSIDKSNTEDNTEFIQKIIARIMDIAFNVYISKIKSYRNIINVAKLIDDQTIEGRIYAISPFIKEPIVELPQKSLLTVQLKLRV